MRTAAVTALAALLAATASPETFTEPKSGVALEVRRDGMSLMGAGLRVKKVAFVKAKVYAIGFYVSDEALAGPLASHRGKLGTPAFYKDLVWGDFGKQVVLRFTRSLGQARIQEAMREALAGADKNFLDTFVGYFPEVKEGEECVLRWGAGGSLESTMAGQSRPPIANKEFAARVFGLYLGETPIQDDIKVDLVSRAPLLLK
jgi:hypothetical protein